MMVDVAVGPLGIRRRAKNRSGVLLLSSLSSNEREAQGWFVKLRRGDTAEQCPTAPNPRDPDSLNPTPSPNPFPLKAFACPPSRSPCGVALWNSVSRPSPDNPLKTSNPFRRSRFRDTQVEGDPGREVLFFPFLSSETSSIAAPTSKQRTCTRHSRPSLCSYRLRLLIRR